MTSETEEYLFLLEKHLSLLRMLAQQLVDCRKEFVAMDLDGIYSRVAEQEELCRQIRSMQPAIVAMRQTCAEQIRRQRQDRNYRPEDSLWTERFRKVIRESRDMQFELSRLNQIHEFYLRRSQKTIQVLMNFIGNYTLTYARPAVRVPAMPRSAEIG